MISDDGLPGACRRFYMLSTEWRTTLLAKNNAGGSSQAAGDTQLAPAQEQPTLGHEAVQERLPEAASQPQQLVGQPAAQSSGELEYLA